MSILFALGAAFFAGLTTIFAKIGLKEINSNLVTAIRCSIIILFSFCIVLVTGVYDEIFVINYKTWIFLILSGLSTGLSWILYFKALSIGDVNKISPIDSSSIVITVITSWLILGESFNITKIFALALIFVGIILMINKKSSATNINSSFALGLAFLSACFASLSSIFGKVGIENVNSNLGTTIRVFVVLIFAWGIVFAKKDYTEIKKISSKSLLFIVLSGVATCLSWLAFYRALQLGDVSVVAVIDKLSILVAMSGAYFILGEKFSKKSLLGLMLLVIGVSLSIIS